MRQLKIANQITKRESKSIDKYFLELSKEKLLTPEEEFELTKIIYETGDPVAKERLTRANLRFVVSVAKQYQVSGMKLEDLISEGNIGLIKAVDRFDPTRGFKFISFAVWWIRQSILHSIDTKSKQIYTPGNRNANMNRIRKASSELEQKLFREPEPFEIAEHLGVEESFVLDMFNHTAEMTSSDATLSGDESSTTISDVLPNTTYAQPDEDITQESTVNLFWKTAEKVLNPMHFKVVSMYLGAFEPAKTIKQIAMELDIPDEKARQLKDSGLNRLKRNKKCSSILLS